MSGIRTAQESAPGPVGSLFNDVASSGAGQFVSGVFGGWGNILLGGLAFAGIATALNGGHGGIVRSLGGLLALGALFIPWKNFASGQTTPAAGNTGHHTPHSRDLGFAISTMDPPSEDPATVPLRLSERSFGLAPAVV